MSKPRGDSTSRLPGGTVGPACRAGPGSSDSDTNHAAPGRNALQGPARQAGPTDPIAAEIEAEIADHLATTAEQLQSQGLAPDIAEQKSQEKFGDPATITRRCYWIKQGDALMFRTAVIVLLAMLCVTLGFTTLASYRSQRLMADQMAALADQLKALAEQQRPSNVPAPIAEPKALEITGKVFIGSPDKPAANASLTLIDLKDASRVRSIRADSQGNFNSGPLGGGDYALLTDTSDKLEDGSSPWSVQSAPIAAYPGVAIPPQQMNIERRFGRLSLETSHPLTRLRVDDRYVIESRLLVRVLDPQDRKEAWTRDRGDHSTWPVYVANQPWGKTAAQRGGFRGLSAENNTEREFYEILSQNAIDDHLEGTIFRDIAGQFAAGKVAIAAAILTDIFPADYERPSIDALVKSASKFGKGPGEPRRGIEWYNAPNYWRNARMELQRLGNSELDRPPSPDASPYEQYLQSQTGYDNNDEFYWLTKGLGEIWLDHLRPQPDKAAPPLPHIISPKWLSLDLRSEVPIEAGKTTRLRIEVPSDLEETVKQLVEMSDAQQFSQVTLGDEPQGTSRPRNEPRRTPEARPESPLFRVVKIAVDGTQPIATAGE